MCPARHPGSCLANACANNHCQLLGLLLQELTNVRAAPWPDRGRGELGRHWRSPTFSTALGSIPFDEPQSPASAAVRSAGHHASSSPCPETQPVLTRDLLLISSCLAQVSLSLSASLLRTSRSLSTMP